MVKQKGKKYPFEVRLRAFRIWQKLGVNPWAKANKKDGKNKPGDFYKGAFDSIPFLNDDAKRTFVHLLLRPGYMIRDYIKGDHEKYLAPLTALIIFYAFFALVSSVLQPVQHDKLSSLDPSETSISLGGGSIEVRPDRDSMAVDRITKNTASIVQRGYIYLHLDQYPEAVQTKAQASLAALEGALRSQGIPLFISDFLILWLAMAMTLRRRKISMSACAAASAYVLCQFSFFMLFAVLISWGKSASISVSLMLLLLVVDYRQWLNLPWKQSLKLTIVTGIYYALLYLAVILAISALVLIVAYFK